MIQMNQRSWNLAQEVAEKTTDEAERKRMEALLAASAAPAGLGILARPDAVGSN